MSNLSNNPELRTHGASKALEFIYRFLGGNRRRSVARIILNLIFRLEGGQYRSATARKLLERDYSIKIGPHSYGNLFVPGAFSPSVEVGNYTSVAKNVCVFTQNHPTNALSTHPYFYEKKFHYITDDTLKPATTIIGHDVWIGHGATILPSCKNIATGAIIGAGSVVTKDVPAYAIAAGNPAKILKFRFNDEKIQTLIKSKWWELPPEQVVEFRENLKDNC